MRFAHPHPMTRMRRVEVTNPYSGELELGPWDTAVVVVVPGAAIGVSSTVENDEGTLRQVVTSATLYGPYGMDVRTGDRIVDGRGQVWDVDGAVVDWQSPFTGSRPGATCPLTLVKG